jgi:predicted Zn finger-like uncharacterized protein
MKIVCDACQAKYSISDDKVQGKVFKIRCKKCSNIIVVRGGAAAAEAAAPPAQEKEHRVYDYGYEAGDQAPAGDDAVWHVVINQDQVGPMTAGDVQKRFSSGEIDAETYIWREGFGDWMPLAQVDTFAAMAASGSTTAALQPRSSGSGSGAEAIGAMFAAGATGEEAGTVRSDPGDLFASASARAAQAEDDGGDLFGSKPGTNPAAAQAAQAKLRGERNENSVLFSLNNLAQLASNRPAPAPQAQAAAASGGPAPAGHATGGSGGEGSGLIDIRSMASAYLGAQPGAARTQGTSSAIGSIDDLPVFGGGGFSEPAVIVPTARAQNNNKLLYALIGSVGLLAVAAVVLVIVMVKGGSKSESKSSETDKIATSVNPDKPDDKTTSPSTTGTGSDTTKPADTGSGSSTAATPPPPPSDTKTDTAAKPADPKKDKPKPSTTTSSKPSTSSSAAVVSSRTTPKPTTTTPTTTPPPATSGGDSGSCDEVSCVLNNYEGACCAKFKKGGSKPSGGTASGGAKPAGGGGDLPASLDRSMISEGVAKVKAAVQRCGDKSSAKGTVKVGVKVTPDGSVASVTVKETPDGALGGCVQSAMSRASFKKTQNGGSFSFPFVF